MGNAAIGEIQAQNAATEEAQARANLQPATIESQPLQVDDLVPSHMTMDTTLVDGTYTVQSGDSISTILGTSNPGAIGAFMAANGLTSSTIYPGEQVVIPSGGYSESDARIGQDTLYADNQRIAALHASQSNNTFTDNIQFGNPPEGEQGSILNLFPDATYGSDASANNGDALVDTLFPALKYEKAAFAGAYNGIQDIPSEAESIWNGAKTLAARGLSDVTSCWDNGADPTPVVNSLAQLPGDVQNLPVAFGNHVQQDSIRLLNYLRNTSGTQIAYDAGYGVASNAPWLVLGAATDGAGFATEGGEAFEIAGAASGANAIDLTSFEASGLRAERILPGTSDKIAVIGRTMGSDELPGVRDYAAALQAQGVDVEIFDGNVISDAAQREFAQLTADGNTLSNQDLMQTQMYQENKAWAMKIRQSGYTVIDLGNPYPSIKGFSPFYSMEKNTVFGGGH